MYWNIKGLISQEGYCVIKHCSPEKWIIQTCLYEPDRTSYTMCFPSATTGIDYYLYHRYGITILLCYVGTASEKASR